MNDTHVSELIPGYALGALDVEEQILVDAHLARCPECRAELESYQPVVASLAFAANGCEPGRDLRDRVLSRIAAGPLDSTAIPGQPRRQRSLISLPAWALAAAATMFIGLLIWNGILQVQLMRQREHLASQTEVVALLALADEAGVLLQGTEAAPMAKGRLIPDPDRQGAALVVQGMPAPPPGRVYQLWLIRSDGGRDNGGLFTVDGGRAILYVRPPASLDSYVAIGVTDEPARGSPRPTGTKVLGGSL